MSDHKPSDHKPEEMQGRAKEAAGAMTGDEDLKREGKSDKTGAKAKDKATEAIDKVKGAFKKR